MEGCLLVSQEHRPRASEVSGAVTTYTAQPGTDRSRDDGLPRRQTKHLDLCREFLEEILNAALAEAAALDPEGGTPEVDWDAILDAAELSKTPEGAVGAVILAATEVAAAIVQSARNNAAGARRGSHPANSQPVRPLAYPVAGPVLPVAGPVPPLAAPEAHVAPLAPPVAAPEVRVAPLAPTTTPPEPVALSQPAAQFLTESDPNRSWDWGQEKVARRAAPAAVRHPAATRSRRLKLGIAISTWVRNIGVIVIIFAAWQLWGTGLVQHQAQHQLASQFHATEQGAVASATSRTAATTSSPDSGSLPLLPPDASAPGPAEGSAIARLQIPAIGLDQFVVQGTAEGDLSKGPGHYIGTPLPGHAGNVAIAGHRTTWGAPFNRLGDLALGNPIYLTTLAGRVLRYVVARPPTAVSPGDTAVLGNFGDDRLTLTTCNPEYSASQRLVVVARYDPLGVKATATSGHAQQVIDPQSPETPISTAAIRADAPSGWNLGHLPEILLAILLLVALGLVNRRVYRRYGGFPGGFLVLGLIWAVGLYFLFQALSSFLPASL